MLALILGFITGLAPAISEVSSRLLQYKTAKLDAETDKEKAVIEGQIQELHDRRAVLVAEAGSRLGAGINASTRFLLALGPLLVLLKLFAWDKVIGSFEGCAGTAGHALRCATFNTDPLDPNLWWVIISVVGFYFLASFKK